MAVGSIVAVQAEILDRNTALSGLDLSTLGYVPYYNGSTIECDVGIISSAFRFTTIIENNGSTPVDFTDAAFTDGGGASIVTGTPPLTIPPWSYQYVTIEIGVDAGSVNFDTYVTLNTTGGSQTFRFYGTRIKALGGYVADLIWEPDWGTTVTDRLEWKTDILVASDRTEQRSGLLQVPRRSISYTYTEWGPDRYRLETLLSGRGVSYFYLPLWFDTVATTASNTSGSTKIVVDTTSGNFVVDGYVMIYEGPDKYDISRVMSLTNSDITILEQLTNDYSTSALVVPVLAALPPKKVSITNKTDDASTYKCTFSIYKNYAPAASHQFEVYNGNYIFPFAVNFDDPSIDISHKWKYYDNESGLVEIVQSATETIYTYTISLRLVDRVEVDLLRQFLHLINGKRVPFYMENTSISMRLAASVVSGSVTVDVYDLEFTNVRLNEAFSEHVKFVFSDGSSALRRIVSVEKLSDGVERLTISDPFPFDVDENNLTGIYFFPLCRLDDDKVEFVWYGTVAVDVKLQVVALP